MKLFLILVGILFLLAIAFVVYCCLVMASIADSRLQNLYTEDHQQTNESVNIQK